MTWLDTRRPKDDVSQQVQTLLKHAFVHRVQPAVLVRSMLDLTSRHRVNPRVTATILMGFRSRENIAEDARLFRYTKVLLQKDLISSSDLLLAMLDRSAFSRGSDEFQLHNHQSSLATCEEQIFNVVTQMYTSGEVKLTARSAHNVIFALARWLHLVTEHEDGKQLELGGLHAIDPCTCNMYEALAMLTLATLTQPAIRAVSKQSWWKARRPTVVSVLENFDSHILQWMHSPFAGRLQALAKIPPFLETDSKGLPMFSAQQVQEAVPELPVVHTRAGLYVWLNACLCGCPSTDDIAMLGYLQTRYNGDSQTAAMSLMMASFDVLTNCLLRKESRQSIKVIRSFICNKTPLLLSMLASFLAPPASMESCIQLAFISITMDALPPISAGATDVRDMLKRVRLDFLQACALHNLISESAISGVTQEPFTLSRTAKLNKETLVTQCDNNVGRLENLMDELAGMHGNAGAIAGAVVDLVNNLCMNKDTMSLKSVCNILIRKIADIDIIMQYTRPAGLLLQLTTILNEWIHDQDQAEFTPSYEEFASILLFTLAVIHRYDLKKSDIDASGSASFVFQLLQGVTASSPTSDLTTEQSERLAKWVEGLYSTDDSGETSGISDDVMRHCPPPDFYLLVPLLFEQSVLSCRANILSLKTLKGGLELLLEPFLLPSLLGGLSWLVKHSWEDHGDADILLQILEKLLKPSSSSQDTQAMHRAIVAMVAEPLIHSLQALVRRQPSKKNASSLIDLLKSHLGRQRTNHGTKAELHTWSSTADGGLPRCIRNTINDLVTWSSSVGPTPPTPYTHTMISAACNILGSEMVLASISAELVKQTSEGHGPIAFDIATNIICAPIPGLTNGIGSIGGISADALLNMRDVLRFACADVQRLLDRPRAEAETLVRLERRVEMQSAPSAIAQLPLALPIEDQAADQMMQDLGLADAAVGAGADAGIADGVMQVDDPNAAAVAAAAAVEFAAADLSTQLDLTSATNQDFADLAAAGSTALQISPSQDFFGDLNMDMGAPSSLTGDGTQANQEEDIFAGLDMGDLGDDFTFA